MITKLGYGILKDRYSEPISNPNILKLFIQKMYLHRLEEQYEMGSMFSRHIEKMPKDEQGLAIAMSLAPMSVGPCFVGFNVPPQPFYKECLELADFILGLRGVHFHEFPYVPTPNGMVENKYFVAQQISRGEMPNLTKKEMDFAKKEIKARFKTQRYNVVHNILGTSGSSCKILVSCCKIEREDLKFIGRQW